MGTVLLEDTGVFLSWKGAEGNGLRELSWTAPEGQCRSLTCAMPDTCAVECRSRKAQLLIFLDLSLSVYDIHNTISHFRVSERLTAWMSETRGW
jgi:hypothetical protein